MSNCKECNGDGYVVLGCCSGRECGCMGRPVAVSNCKECNPLASLPMSESLKEESKHLEYIGAR